MLTVCESEFIVLKFYGLLSMQVHLSLGLSCCYEAALYIIIATYYVQTVHVEGLHNEWLLVSLLFVFSLFSDTPVNDRSGVIFSDIKW